MLFIWKTDLKVRRCLLKYLSFQRHCGQMVLMKAIIGVGWWNVVHHQNANCLYPGKPSCQSIHWTWRSSEGPVGPWGLLYSTGRSTAMSNRSRGVDEPRRPPTLVNVWALPLLLPLEDRNHRRQQLQHVTVASDTWLWGPGCLIDSPPSRFALPP